jgi:transmembrane 9 superfamily member 2/4
VPTEEERAEEREESGWKLVHADVFRPPSAWPMLFCVLVGTGMQLVVMALATIIFAAIGFLSPANRGSLMIAVLLLYVLFGGVAGFTSASVYKSFKGRQYQACTLWTALLYPGVAFAVFFVLDLVSWGYGSTQAVPFFSMAALLLLWFGISVPLVFLGAYFGYKRPAMEFPVVTSNIPRQIPDQPWFLQPLFTISVGGILPFGAVFVEMFFILSSIWMGQYYYVFGFLFLVFVILLVTCADITMVFCYFQLCSEDYHWWWRSFLTAGSTAVYVFLYRYVFTNLLTHLLTVFLIDWLTYLLVY